MGSQAPFALSPLQLFKHSLLPNPVTLASAAALLSPERAALVATPVSPRLLTPLGIPRGERIPVLVDDGSGNEVAGAAGVNIALLSSGLGLMVRVSAYVNMNEGDDIFVFWNNATVPAVSTTLVAGEPDHDVFLMVPPAAIVDGQASVFHRVIRNSGVADESDPIQVLVKLTLPGGFDPEAGVPGHQGLLAPSVPVSVVLPEHLVSGIDVSVPPYLNMRVRDTLTLSWGGITQQHSVAASEVGNPLTIHVSGDTIARAGDSLRLEVIYKVIDEVENQSIDGNGLPWSVAEYVEVEAGQDLLEAPYADAYPDDVIDLNELGNANVDVSVFLTTGQFSPGDEVTLSWAGRTADDVPQEFQLTQTVPSGRTMHFIIPNAEVQKLPNGRTRISYTRTRAANGIVHRSRSTTLRIVGQVLQLPAPGVRENQGGTVLPSLPFATVDIQPWVGMAEGQPLSVIWTGLTADNRRIYFEDPTPVSANEVNRVVTRLVPASYIAPLDGSTVEVSYMVTLNGTVRDSDTLLLNVGVATGTLTPPSVDEASDGYLDPANLPLLRATLRIPHGNVIQPGDRITFFWTGDSSGPYSDSNTAASGTSTTFYIPLVHIAPNLGGDAIVYYRVQRNNVSIGTSRELLLPIGNNAIALPPPSVPLAENDQLDPRLAASNPVIALLTFDDMQVSDLYSIAVFSNGQIVHQSEQQPGSPFKQLHFTIPNSVIASHLDSDVQIYSAMVRGTASSLSQPYTLTVLPFRLEDLPTPEMPDAEGPVGEQVLDIGKLTTDPLVRIAPWPLMAVGQKVWLRLVGVDEAGGEVVIVVADGVAVSASEVVGGFGRTASLVLLQGLEDGSELRAEGKVGFDADSEELQAVDFPPALLTVVTGPPVEDFKIDQSLMSLTGALYLNVNHAGTPSPMPSNTTAVRLATGGVEPYIYSSNNASIATVENGRVESRSNGTATITVREQTGQELTFQVSITGVQKFRNAGSYTWDQQGKNVSQLLAYRMALQCYLGGGFARIGLPSANYWMGIDNLDEYGVIVTPQAVMTVLHKSSYAYCVFDV
ncbi:MAG: hypothetical protein PW845_09780 [Pseudomonas sp.]|nr:hypothetical protein [Pseudomonas sp.]